MRETEQREQMENVKIFESEKTPQMTKGNKRESKPKSAICMRALLFGRICVPSYIPNTF